MSRLLGLWRRSVLSASSPSTSQRPSPSARRTAPTGHIRLRRSAAGPDATPACPACRACRTAQPVATQPWEEKCEWVGCGGCTECSVPPPSPPAQCKTYCAYRTHPIEEKCEWSGCNGCGECELSPHPPPCVDNDAAIAAAAAANGPPLDAITSCSDAVAFVFGNLCVRSRMGSSPPPATSHVCIALARARRHHRSLHQPLLTPRADCS